MTTEPTGKGGKRPLRIGRYEVLHHIGSGGMGAVYKALDLDNNREVALKVMPPDLAANPKMLARFHREAKAAAKLRHDNVVAIYEFGEAAGTFFLALEFIDGTDLHEYIKQHGQLAPDLARELLKQAAKALAHAHSQGIVHRDIKPSNFIIATQADGQPLLKLIDLGLARQAREEEARVTRDGTTVGTVDYMSPEQAHDAGAADVRSDIYSLGCTFYHMLAGHAPFPEGSLIERLTKHVNVEPPDIRELNAEVPEDLAYVLGRMLRKRPEDRYQTPLEILRDLLNPDQIDYGPRLVPLDDGPRIGESRSKTLSRRLDEADKPTPVPDRNTPRPPPVVVAAAPEPVIQRPRTGRRRLRDEDDDEPRRKKRPPSPAPPLVLIALAAAFFLVVAVGLVILLWPRGASQATPTEETGKSTRTGDTPKKKPTPKTTSKDTAKDKPKEETGPPRLYPRDVVFDPALLRVEFEGPLAITAGPEPADHVLMVSRLGGTEPGTFATLAGALAAAPEGRRTYILIADNGPIYLPSMPALAKRDLVLMAARTFRPLLVWEAAGDKSSALLNLTGGSLQVQDLEFAVKGSDLRGDEPPAFFKVTDGTFVARNCVFSVAGKHPRGFVVARLDAPGTPGSCRLSNCYARGFDLAVLNLRGAGWDVHIDDCLLVGGASALVEAACADKSALTLRVLRSTLVATNHGLLLHAPAAARPALRLLWLDSLLARSDSQTEGSLLATSGAVDLSNTTLRAVNCVYAGWHKLLAADMLSIEGGDLAGWRKHWGHADGDRALIETWPRHRPPEPEETPAGVYHTKGGQAHFVAVSAPGMLGSPLTYGERLVWIGLTSDRFVYPALPLPTGTLPLDATVVNVDLNKDGDLAQALAGARPGQRLVLHLSGSGEFEIDPVVVKGIDLVLYADPPADAKAKPLTLAPSRLTSDGKEALFDIEGGSLELINIRVVFENRPAIMPRRMLRLKGADLRLHGCWLQGPLDKAPPGYLALIDFTGTGREQAEAVHNLALMQSVLMSGGKVLELHGAGSRLRMQHCVVLAAQDGVAFDIGTNIPERLNVQLLLERNTFAVRRQLFVQSEPASAVNPVEPIVLQSEGNLFTDPFTELPRTSSLLGVHPAALHRGLLLWQGKGNAYDEKRLASFASLGDKTPPVGLAGWQQLWGKFGEREPHIVAWPALPGATFTVANPQLDRLRPLPPKGIVYGADLSKLGLGPKKK